MIKYLKVHKTPEGDKIPPRWVVTWVEDSKPYRVEFDNPVDARYEFRTLAEFAEDVENVEDVENAL